MYLKINKAKDQKQKEALNTLIKNPSNRGIISMCTGAGKSKVAIDYYKYLYENVYNKNMSVLLVVPTEKLRDVNWLNEFTDWQAKELYDNLDRCCYASLNKIKDKHYNLVILDEAHRSTENNIVFFENNKVDHIVGLTATLPEDKRELLKSINLNEIFHLSLDEGVKLGIVAPFNISIIECKLDNKDKYIEAGSKDKKFKITEQQQYDYLNKQLRKLLFANGEYPQWLILKRMKFLTSLKSKTKIAENLLKSIHPDKKVIIFCGSIDQAEVLSKNTFHSKTDSKALDDFINNKVKRLSCVNALNEGMNIPGIDVAVIVQVDSKDTNLIQRIGRAVRYREGHLAEIYIISVLDTQDEKWTESALKSFDKSNIKFINYKNIIP